MAIFTDFRQKWRKSGVLPTFGHFSPKMGILGPFGPWRAGVLHQPLARAPGAAQGPGRALPDLREPRRGSPGPGLRIRDPGIPRSLARGPPPGRGGGSRGPRDPAPRGVLHQPLAAGPRGTRRGSPGPGVPGTGFPGLPGGPRPPPAGAGLQTPLPDPPGNRGAPARGVDVKPPSAGGLGTSKSRLFRDFGENGRFSAFSGLLQLAS